jgi:hypothetical protein
MKKNKIILKNKVNLFRIRTLNKYGNITGKIKKDVRYPISDDKLLSKAVKKPIVYKSITEKEVIDTLRTFSGSKPTTTIEKANRFTDMSSKKPFKRKVRLGTGTRSMFVEDDYPDFELRKRLAARMLVMGYEPFVVAEMSKLNYMQFRTMLRDDPDFRKILVGMEEEVFHAVEKKHKYVLMEALNRLSKCFNTENDEIALQAIDRAFRIHGKYVDRIEDMTPVERKVSPEMAEKILDKGIEYLRLSRGDATVDIEYKPIEEIDKGN